MASTLWTQNSKEASNSHLPTLPCKQLLYRARKIGTNLAAAAAKSLQSCLTLRPHRRQLTRLPHPWDSPRKNTGVGCHFLLQCMKVKVKVKSLSHVWLLATPWTAAYQAPLSMGFSRQEYWSRVPLLSLLVSPRQDWLKSKVVLKGVLLRLLFRIKNVFHESSSF